MSADEGVCISLQGRILAANDAAARALGAQRPEELVGRSFAEFLDEDVADVMARRGAAILDLGATPNRIAYAGRRLDGAPVIIEVAAAPLRVGRRIVALSLLRDVTESSEVQAAARCGCWVADHRTGAVTMSVGVREIVGLSSGNDVTYADLIARVHPEDRPIMDAAWASAIAARQPFELRYRLVMEDERVKHVLTRARATFGPDGKPWLVTGTMTEVTEQVELAQRLAFASRAIEGSPTATAFTDAAGRITVANPAFLRLWGFADEREVLGRQPVDVGDDVDAAAERVRRLLKEGTFVAEIRPRRRDGTTFAARIESAVVKEADGRPLGMMAHFIDLSDREEAGRRLAESERRFRLLHESIRDGIVLTTPDGGLVEWNPAVRDMLGYSDAELHERTIWDLTPSAWHGLARRMVEQACARGWSDLYEKDLARKDGRTVPVEVRVVSVRGEGEQPPAIWHVIRDVTERHAARAALERTERELREAERLDGLGRLAAGIAHDFNNVLAVVMGLGSVLERTLPPASAAAPLARDIVEASERAADLTRQLLTFARARQGEVVDVDVAAVIGTVGRLARRTLGEQIEIVTEVQEGIGSIRLAQGQLERVLMNLAINARDAMPEGGRLQIRARVLGEGPAPIGDRPCVYVEVRDEGTGIADEVRPKIFEPFFTTKAAGGGIGLGLPTVYGIVRQAGGSIRVDSTPGRGSAFHLFFPRSGALASAESGPASPSRRGSETVLLVEDDPATRGVLARMLGEAGYRVLIADGGGKALEIAGSGCAIDLLLSDVVMPLMTGPSLYLELQRERPDLPAIFVSGYAPDEESLGKLGRFVSKPFREETILRAVRNVLDEKGRRAAPGAA